MANQNTHKTHCFKGHPLSGDNLHIVASGSRTGKRVCRACQAKHMRDYAHRYPERIRLKDNKLKKNLRLRYREIVFSHYGKYCHCCGETEEVFLTLEHVGGGGGEHRKRRTRADLVLLDIIRANFPDIYSVLCYNCNMARRWGKSCPHEKGIIHLVKTA